MKSLKKAVLALGLALGSSVAAHAAVSDSLTVTIRPNAFYAVDIDTANVALDLGTVALAASTQTVTPSTVTIQSTYATTDLRLQGAIATPGATPWTFDDDTSSQELDALAAWATFTDVSQIAPPAQGGGFFAGTVAGAAESGVIDATNRYVGTGGGTTDLFEAVGESTLQDMDAQAPNAQSHLWLYFRLPNASSTNDEQNVTITLTAVVPN